MDWFLHQAPCMVVIFTKSSSPRIYSIWIIWSQSNFWNLFFFQCFLWVVSVLNRWKEVHVKGMNGLSKSFSAQSWCEEFPKDRDRCGSLSRFYHISQSLLYFSVVSIHAHKGLKWSAPVSIQSLFLMYISRKTDTVVCGDSSIWMTFL